MSDQELSMSQDIAILLERRSRARIVLAAALVIHFSALIAAIAAGIAASKLSEEIAKSET